VTAADGSDELVHERHGAVAVLRLNRPVRLPVGRLPERPLPVGPGRAG
jgi:hypothetical protein